jgi:hypothetical protein
VCIALHARVVPGRDRVGAEAAGAIGQRRELQSLLQWAQGAASARRRIR